jgi:hypothetical protein
MRYAKRTRLFVSLVVLVGAATLILGHGGAGNKASSAAEARRTERRSNPTGNRRPFPKRAR